VLPLARDYELAVLHTSAPSFGYEREGRGGAEGENPALRIGLVGAHVAVQREASLAASPALDFVCGNEFDFTIREIAEGRALAAVAGLSYRDGRAASCAHARARAARGHGRATVGGGRVRARSRDRALCHRVSPAPLRLALHGPRLPLEVHLLPLAQTVGGQR